MPPTLHGRASPGPFPVGLDEFVVIGHRGNEVCDPENTLPAFERAARVTDWVELDVRASKEGELVVFHDDRLDEKTTGRGKVGSLELAELRRVRVVGPRGTSAPIATLREVLEEFAGRLKFVLEIKAPRVEEALVRALERHDVVDGTIVDSFVWRRVRKLKRLFPRVAASLLVHRHHRLVVRRDWKALARVATKEGAGAVSIHSSVVLDKGDPVGALKRRGLRVFAWGVKDPNLYAKVISSGVNGFTAGDPFLASRMLAERERGPKRINTAG
ncbi:MAG: glycerophosphodiester phosphodiesterase family protein [Promethearchaeota archaeon]